MLFKSKYLEKTISSPDSYMRKYLKKVKPSEYVIILYSQHFIKLLLNKYRFKRESVNIYRYSDKISLCYSQIGSPNAAITLEELKILGFKNIITLGVAGAFGRDINIGDVILVKSALIDEGTSHNYISSRRKFSYADEKLLKKTELIFRKNNLNCLIKSSWTTDAPYRETQKDIDICLKKKVETVDMEASALYSVSEYLGLKSVAVFIISDLLREGKWTMGFNNKIINQRFYDIFSCLIKEL